MSASAGYFQSTQPCPRCRRALHQSILGRDAYCTWPDCGYRRPAPPPDAVTLGIHGRGNLDQLRPRLDRLTERLRIGGLATLFDSGSHLAIEWALQLEVELTNYQCGAKAAGCSFVILVGEPDLPLEQITQGVPCRILKPARPAR